MTMFYLNLQFLSFWARKPIAKWSARGYNIDVYPKNRGKGGREMVVKEDHIGRKFFDAIQNQNFERAADYLTIMVQGHLASGNLKDYNSLHVFLSAHLITAIDLSGNIRLTKLDPFEEIIQAEVERYDREYRDHPDGIALMVHHIMQKISRSLGFEPSTIEGRMEVIKGYIDSNYADPNLSANDLSEKFDLSISYLSRTFKRVTGHRLNDYIHIVRIRRAQELLRGTNIPINEIASMVGFSSSSAFIRSYRTIEGITPGSYREQSKNMKDQLG